MLCLSRAFVKRFCIMWANTARLCGKFDNFCRVWYTGF
nr:MAG TPA: hypothetical protein [Caudoviricetes sp.]